jgi:RNA recognition motif-containing protein
VLYQDLGLCWSLSSFFSVSAVCKDSPNVTFAIQNWLSKMEDSFLQQNGADMQNQNHAASSHDDVEGKIFVGGLSWQTTQESMRFHFEKYGELSDIAIMIDKRTGQPR